ncbi:hypothetical protein HMPREF9413_3898 [Paenibacillus sp. HGF7]|nr:hypothetical protein HMPREF9413_3898 [Paenibacillus sp. HGF7]
MKRRQTFSLLYPSLTKCNRFDYTLIRFRQPFSGRRTTCRELHAV